MPTIPHYLGVKDTSSTMGPRQFFSEVQLFTGEVMGVFKPSNKSNVSKKFTEYSVRVWRRVENGPLERILYHCSQADLFGGIGDMLRFSYRPSTGDIPNSSINNGSTVLVMCISGDRSNAYVVGAVPHPKRTIQDPEDNRYLRAAFNGVTFNVNDDGSLELTVPGATDANGRPASRDSNNKGSKVTIAANGDITVDDQNGDSVKVSPGSKSVEVVANTVNVISGNINLGDTESGINPLDGVVVGSGIDSFTGAPYNVLGNSSSVVKAKK